MLPFLRLLPLGFLLAMLLAACASSTSPNSAPTCEITAPAAHSEYAESDQITFAAVVGDAETPRQLLTVSWSSDQDDELGSSSPTSEGDVVFPSQLSAANHVVTLNVTDERGSTCTDNVIVHVGSAPTIELTTPTTAELFSEGAGVIFSATVGDAQDAPEDLQLTWVSDVNGQFSTHGADSVGLAEHVYEGLSRGPHTITVTVKDSAQMEAFAAVDITINGIPSAPSASISPTSPRTTDNLTTVIDTPSVDPEGDEITYKYAWYQNGVLSTASDSFTLPSSATARGEQWSVTVTPNDGHGDGASSGTASVTIGNSPPYISTGSITPNPASAGDTLTCNYTFVDADGDSDSSSLAWTINGTAAGTNTTLTGGFANGDVVACTVTPFDGTTHGEPEPFSMTIGNTTPIVTSLALGPASPQTNDTLTAVAVTFDADGDDVTVSYAWHVNLALIAATGPTLNGATWFSKGDAVHVIVTPNDGIDNGAPSQSDTVTVVNTPPGAPDVSITPAAPPPGGSLLCSVTTAAPDADGDSITYTMAWTVDGSAYAGATTTTWPNDTVPASVTASGEVWACVATPNDGTANGATDSAAVTIASPNTPPEITTLTLTPSDVYTNTTITATPVTFDADGDSVTVSYDWYVNSTLIAATGPTLAGTTWFDKGDSVYVVGTPNDGTDDGAAKTSATTVVLNSAPGAPDVNITPATPIAGGSLSCNVSTAAPDADGDSVAYTMAWTVDGSPYAGATTTTWPNDTVPASVTANGENWACIATPNDGAADGTTDSALVTIGSSNHLPEITTLTLAPSDVYTNTTITATATTFDADGDTVTVSYAWYVNSTLIAATGPTLDGTTWFDKADSVYVVATPNDGTGDGPSGTSATVVVSNTAPTAPIAAITPATPTQGGSLLCSITTAATDIDGDSLTYTMSWSRNGTPYAGASTTTWPNDTIPIGVTNASETWLCAATPNDGDDDGSIGSDSVVVYSPGCPVYADANVLPGGDGSYANPYPSIGYAIAYRGTCDEIVLKPGTYDELLDYAGEALHIRSELGPLVTIIDPAVGGDVVTFENGETATSILEGMTVTGGTTHGIYINDASPTIKDCVINGNSGTYGAGVHATSYDGTFSGNTVSSNSASSYGGGLYLLGGEATIINNWFEANSAQYHYGSALFLRAEALVANNVFLDNDSDDDAIFLDWASTSSYDSSNIINNTIVGSNACGIRIDSYSSNYPQSDVINNIICNSGNYNVCGASSPFNSVTWESNNVHGASYTYPSSSDQTGTKGNISQPPHFTDAGAKDFTLEWGSWCIDTGQDVSSYDVTVDMEGDPRLQGVATDMGAYEFAGPTDDCDGIDDGPQCATGCPVYADPTVTPGGNGAYATPYPSIGYAIAYRESSCSEIVLKPGTYDELLDYAGKELHIRSELGPAVTIIDPAVGGDVVTFKNGETATSILEGVTVTGGTTHGIYIDTASPTIKDCVINGNSGTYGGGVHAEGYSGTFSGNTVSNNSATSYGGGFYLLGGEATIINNWFEANSAQYHYGSALFLRAEALVANNVFLDNDSDDDAIFLDWASTSSYDSSNIINNTIVGSNACGIRIDSYSSNYPQSDVINNIICNSGNYNVCGASSPFNSVTWESNNVHGASYTYPSSSDQTGTKGNISQPPHFTDAGAKDFTLEWGSWCIDTGQDVSSYDVTVDMEGDPRLQGVATDMGAYEFTGPTDDCDGDNDGPQCATGCPVYADPTVTPGGNGAYATPYPSIGYAIAYRESSCSEIVLKPGTFDELLDYAGEALHIRSELGPTVTIIDPAVGGDVVTFDGGETSTSILEGITVTGGTSHGIYINGAYPTIKDCVISGNSGTYGAGVHATSYDGTFSGNTVSNNSATSYGGGFYLLGGEATIINNWFEANSAQYHYGSALFLRAEALVANNVFLDNDSDDDAIFLDWASTSSYDSSKIINNTIVGSNSCGIRIDSYSSYYPQSDVINNIICNSGNYNVCGASSPFNSVTWESNNVHGASYTYPSGGDQTGTNGNISQPPQFTDADGDDFTLVWGSWCIDTGENVSSYGVTDDYVGTTRPVGLAYDMGAYEYF